MKLTQICNLWCLGGTTTCALAVVKALPDWEHEIVARVHPTPIPDPPPGGKLTFHPGCPPIPPATDYLLLHDTPADVMPDLPPVPTVMLHHSPAGNRTPAHVNAYVSEWLRGGRPGVTLYQSVDRIPTRSQSGRFVVGRMATPSDRAKWEGEDLLAQLPNCEREVVGGTSPGAHTLPAHQHAARMILPLWSVLLYHSPVTESFGRVVVEAMAAGCVPLVDPRGGPAETVTHELTGFHCRNGTDFLSRAVQLRDDRELWQAMSGAAQAWTRYQFSHEMFGWRLRQAFAAASARARSACAGPAPTSARHPP